MFLDGCAARAQKRPQADCLRRHLACEDHEQISFQPNDEEGGSETAAVLTDGIGEPSLPRDHFYGTRRLIPRLGAPAPKAAPLVTPEAEGPNSRRTRTNII